MTTRCVPDRRRSMPTSLLAATRNTKKNKQTTKLAEAAGSSSSSSDSKDSIHSGMEENVRLARVAHGYPTFGAEAKAAATPPAAATTATGATREDERMEAKAERKEQLLHLPLMSDGAILGETRNCFKYGFDGMRRRNRPVATLGHYVRDFAATVITVVPLSLLGPFIDRAHELGYLQNSWVATRLWPYASDVLQRAESARAERDVTLAQLIGTDHATYRCELPTRDHERAFAAVQIVAIAVSNGIHAQAGSDGRHLRNAFEHRLERGDAKGCSCAVDDVASAIQRNNHSRAVAFTSAMDVLGALLVLEACVALLRGFLFSPAADRLRVRAAPASAAAVAGAGAERKNGAWCNSDELDKKLGDCSMVRQLRAHPSLYQDFIRFVTRPDPDAHRAQMRASGRTIMRDHWHRHVEAAARLFADELGYELVYSKDHDHDDYDDDDYSDYSDYSDHSEYSDERDDDDNRATERHERTSWVAERKAAERERLDEWEPAAPIKRGRQPVRR